MNHHTRIWSLQDAKARLSEVIRLAQTEGPQTVTVHGKEAVIISAATPARKVAGKYEPTGTGLDLVRAMQACPVPDFEIPTRPLDSIPDKIVEFD